MEVIAKAKAEYIRRRTRKFPRINWLETISDKLNNLFINDLIKLCVFISAEDKDNIDDGDDYGDDERNHRLLLRQ